MRDIRRSWHCRRLFFRYLRQRDKEKEAEKQLYRQNTTPPSEKPNPQFDKFSSAISITIVATIFIGFIFIFIFYYVTLACLAALVLEFLIMVIGAIHFGRKERKQEETEAAQPPIRQSQNLLINTSKTNLSSTLYASPQKEPTTTQTVNENESSIVLEPFDMLTGVQFKDLIERHFKKNGYSVNRISPRINSIDFLVEKDGNIIAVATKHTFDLIQRSYISNVIESAKMYDNISKTMIITTSMYFMPQAQQLADEYGIILWDREKLKTNLGGLK